MPGVQTDIIDGISSSLAVKAPVRAIAAENLALFGLGTIQSHLGPIEPADGDRILAPAQADARYNGIWIARSTSWVRAADFDGSRDVVQGTRVYAADGGSVWVVTSENPNRPGTTAISFEQQGREPAASDQTLLSDLMNMAAGFDPYNPPSAYTQFARAIRQGVAKVVFVGDSLTTGTDGSAMNSHPQRLAQHLQMMFPNVAFTFINRAIPGSRFSHFLDGAFIPANIAVPGPPRGVLSYWGSSANDLATAEELTYRWPEGADNINDPWKDVVEADAPDLLVIGFGFNDIVNNGASLLDIRADFFGFAAYVAGFSVPPSVVWVTEHTTNPDYVAHAATPRFEQMLQGLNAMGRAGASNLGWGLYDAGRYYDRVVRGFDPLRRIWDMERWLGGFDDVDLWVTHQNGFIGDGMVTGAGTENVALDSTGQHAGASAVTMLRQVMATGLAARFTIRKLATAGDVFAVVLGIDDSDPDVVNPNVATDKLQVQFFNAGGVGKVRSLMDGTQILSFDTAPFPTDDLSGVDVLVVYDGTGIKVWIGNADDPNAPSFTFPFTVHMRSHMGLSYFNLVGAPAVKVTNIVLQFLRETQQTELVRDPQDVFGGPGGSYLTTAMPQGGDGGAHPSMEGYELMYGPASWPVLAAIRAATGAIQGTQTTSLSGQAASFTVTAGMDGRVQPVAFVAPGEIRLPGPASGLALGWSAIFLQLTDSNGGTANFVPLDGTANIIAELGTRQMTGLGRAVRARLVGNIAGVYQWMLEPYGTPQITQFANGSVALQLGAHNDGAQYLADSETAFLLSVNNITGDLELYVDTGLTPGVAFVPTKHATLHADGRLSGTSLHKNAGSLTGTVNQYIASGTWAPALLNIANIAAALANGVGQWMRVGNVVHCTLYLQIDPDLAATLTILGITLPIASNIGVQADVAGVASNGGPYHAIVVGNAAADRADLVFTTNGADLGNSAWTVSFQYEVR